MEKNIERTLNLQRSFHGRGFSSVDLRAGALNINPYLILTEFNMSQPFFPPHPHAGVSVATYIFPDSAGGFINRDSYGDNSRIEPGGLHLTQAGVGMQHEEIPEKNGVNVHGMQIWINHSAQNRLSEARAYHAGSGEIPEVKTENSTIRVIFGEYEGQKSPIQPLTRVNLFDVYLNPNSELTLQISDNEQFIGFVLDGNGELNNQKISAVEGLELSKSGNEITLKSGENGLHLLLSSGEEIDEPIVYGGPFVMNTSEQLLETKRRFSRGEMGVLEPSVAFH
jgi:quercetin 2,3-dioxygenase